MQDISKNWHHGYGVIKRRPDTLQHAKALLAYLKAERIAGDHKTPETLFSAADRLASAAMWLAVHQAYAQNIYLNGKHLSSEDFKPEPQGHLGGSLNMIPAYVGYLLANALTGFTRGWVMEQGHAVAAIDSVNLLTGNMSAAHAERYDISNKGLSRFARDFYSYALNAQGQPDSPLGSHVNAHTSGGIMEGGYLGFAGLEYVHMPLPGEHLVAFLSDGAWEEQKGSDWAPRWWRREDCGLVVPIMIANGRRIDQRTTMAQEGGATWFSHYLKMHGFDPIIIDGRDPLAFAWAIIFGEQKLKENIQTEKQGHVRLPYVIAVAPKGAGFYGEGTGAAHNLPLGGNPAKNRQMAARFNKYAHKLHVPEKELKNALQYFSKHKLSKREAERDNPLANRRVKLKSLPKPHFTDVGKNVSPMDAVDYMFRHTVLLNPHLRPRVGNPDEMLSNRMDDTLKFADFRVRDVEKGAEESLTGNVITALNEEAIAAAAFGNKGGINMIVTYEAFAEKMHGIARQEVIFARHKKEAGNAPGWLSVPLLLTSNTWENGKNELSHQDPSMAETMFGEDSATSRVFFPADYNCASFLMGQVYTTHGQLWTIVAAKQKTPVWFSREECSALWKQGALRLSWAGYEADRSSLTLAAIGTYQLMEALKASKRLAAKKIAHAVVYIQEPGKLRTPRNASERKNGISDAILKKVIPAQTREILLVTHTRPEPLVGALPCLWQGRSFNALGFINEGGTLDADGMLFVNKCSWAHIVQHAAALMKISPDTVLTKIERAALDGKRSPDGVIRKIK